MQDFDLTYWFDSRVSSTRTSGASVTERIQADGVEAVIARTEANLARSSFLIDLGGGDCPSLALIRSEAVRYVQIEALGEAEARPAFKVDLEPGSVPAHTSCEPS